jgi:hypothetical protein
MANKKPVQEQRHEGDPGRTTDAEFEAAQKEQDAIERVLDFVQSVQNSTSEIKSRIIRCRKNYAGEFDNPKTKYTKRKKVFVPLTPEKIDGILPKLMVDEKSLLVDPVEEGDVNKAKIFQELLKFQSRRIGLFEKFNVEQLRQLLIDGTIVTKTHWKFEEDDNEEDELGEPKIIEDTVAVDFIDLLDFYIDPLAESIEKTEAVAFTSIRSLRDVKENDEYENVEFLEGFYAINERNDKKEETMKYDIDETLVDVDLKKIKIIEYWTNDRIITVGADMENGSAVLLRDIDNPFGRKMFSECWYEKRANRWHGVGVAERLLHLQNWHNQTTNTRIDSRLIVLNPMFKKRRGAAVDVRELISRPGGFIEVENMADIEPLPVFDLSDKSFQDENDINGMADRLTSAFELVRGGGTPKTASEAIIQSESARGFFDAKLGNIKAFFVDITEQMILLDKMFLEPDMVIRITGDTNDFKEIDDRLGIPEQDRAEKGKFRFINLDDTSVLEGEFDLKVDLDVGGGNRALKVKQLMDLLTIVNKDPESGISKKEVYRELIKTWDLNPDRFIKDEEEQQLPELTQPGVPGGQRPTAIPPGGQVAPNDLANLGPTL